MALGFRRRTVFLPVLAQPHPPPRCIHPLEIAKGLWEQTHPQTAAATVETQQARDAAKTTAET